MKRLYVLSLLTAALFATSAQAQFAIYGNFETTHVSQTSGQSATWFYGPQIGAYYDFIHFGPVSAGLDLRGNLLFGDKLKYRSVLGGVRVAVKPPLLPVKPYAQFLVGAGGSKADGTSSFPAQNYSTKFQYQVLGGVDFTVLPHVDWRVAEVGYGRMKGVSGSSINPDVNLVSVGSGVVVRF